jgi:hypothetical protein
MQEVFSGNIPKDLKICPKCGDNNQNFIIHERRRRIFYVIVKNYVKKVIGLLGRWKCTVCNGTFTYYPAFAIPHKNYVTENILELTQKYLAGSDTTYRRTVSYNNMPIGYDSETDWIDERQLSASTVWRWLSFIASLRQTLHKALGLIRQRAPSAETFRKISPVFCCKYRSFERKKLLQRCSRFFIAEEFFKKIFFSSIFPGFATKNGWK